MFKLKKNVCANCSYKNFRLNGVEKTSLVLKRICIKSNREFTRRMAEAINTRRFCAARIPDGNRNYHSEDFEFQKR